MLKDFIERADKWKSILKFSPRVVIAIPSGITEVEKKAVEDAAEQAGAREIYLIEEPMAAAIGAGLPVHEPGGSLVVDIGGGTTEVAVISLAGIVVSQTVRVAGDEIDEAITEYMKGAYNLMIGQRTAESVKIKIGSAFPLPEEQTTEIKGRDLVSGLPKTVTITSEEIREAISESVHEIMGALKKALGNTPPELAADLVDRGVLLVGGGALLRGIDELFKKETGLPVKIAEDPLTSVALGAGKVLEEIEILRPAVTV
jgi:rod shape-determining protein MreB